MNREKALEYLQQNNNEDAIKIYNYLIMCGNYDFDDMNSLGVAYYRNNEYNNAMVVFNELLHTNPNFIPARVNYAQIIYNECMKKHMNPHEQIKELKRALSYDPNCFIIWHALAITYVIANKPQRALTTIHMALKIDPTNIDGLVTMSKIYSLGGMWYDTKEICAKILEKYPTNQYAKDEYQHAKSILENMGVMWARTGYILHIDKVMYKICDGLYIGSMGAANNLTGLKQNNITHILNVAAEVPNYFENSSEIKITYAHETLIDAADNDIIQNDILGRCIGFITNAIESGGCVLVHCQAGISRSGAMVVAYLMKSQNLTYNDVLAKVRSIRPCVCPNIGFERQIKTYFGETPLSVPIHRLTTILDCLKGSVPANIYKK